MTARQVRSLKEMQRIHSVLKFEQDYPSSHYTDSGSEEEFNSSKNKQEESQKSTNSTTFTASPSDIMFKFKKPKAKLESTVSEVNPESFALSISEAKKSYTRLKDLQ